jgi:hypothetical protein
MDETKSKSLDSVDSQDDDSTWDSDREDFQEKDSEQDNWESEGEILEESEPEEEKVSTEKNWWDLDSDSD